MLNFVLNEDIKKQMAEKNVSNIILSSKIRSCWSGSYAEVSAKFSQTPADDTFEVYEVDGFNVYVQPGIRFKKETVTLGYEKMLFFERILIDGANVY